MCYLSAVSMFHALPARSQVPLCVNACALFVYVVMMDIIDKPPCICCTVFC